eukprot:GHVS01035387.1.p1 GENE.GHVS01035387.1~~GHVS01035387.1.p1  ORF type:complete len:460 (+),score=71.74 GHVS01035387.1:12-1391(+)
MDRLPSPPVPLLGEEEEEGRNEIGEQHSGGGGETVIANLPPALSRSISSLAEVIPSALLLVTTHCLMLLSMALYAGNYVFFRLFNEHGHSAFLFSLLRTLLSIPFIPLVYYMDPKNSYESRRGEEVQSSSSPQTRSAGASSFDSRESYIQEGIDVPTPLDQPQQQQREMVRRRGWWDNLRVHPKARVGLTVAAIAGAIRQMIVPIALMFTSAANAGLIQPSVPVLTAFLAIALRLESGGIFTWVSITLSACGLFIAGRAWDLRNIDKGFTLLLLVPVSKGLQVIGLQFASKYERSSVLQLYQIVGLVLFIVPVATLAELALYTSWSFTKMMAFVGELDAISWGAVVYSAVSIILVCWRIQLLGVKVIGSVGVALYQAFQPVFAFLLGHFILGEPLLAAQAIGASIVCLGLIVYHIGQVQQRKWQKEEVAREMDRQASFLVEPPEQPEQRPQLKQSLLGN